MADTKGTRATGGYLGAIQTTDGSQSQRQKQRENKAGHIGDGGFTGWDNVEWIECRDGFKRPIEPGSFPLADGVPARMGRLRGYGNAIVPPLAKVFIESYLDLEGAIA